MLLDTCVSARLCVMFLKAYSMSVANMLPFGHVSFVEFCVV